VILSDISSIFAIISSEFWKDFNGPPRLDEDRVRCNFFTCTGRESLNVFLKIYIQREVYVYPLPASTVEEHLAPNHHCRRVVCSERYSPSEF
jgi:hypothetical protein